MFSRLTIAVFIYLATSIVTPADAQQNDLTFTSSNPGLQTAFARAKEMALHYKGKPGDPVGPWYESALPPRYAFCMRDVAHQAIPAEALGMKAANKNMFSLFAKNISESKDWCSYWEINKYGKPAPEDYRNDTAFWYNLNANFDILNASWKLYLWTGDRDYISGDVFKYFHDKSASDYITRWVLQPDSLLTRPAHPNAGAAYNDEDAFHRARGLPSYSEGVPNMKMGIDLVAAIYRGLLSYAAILKENGKTAEAKQYEQKAALYQAHIDKHWWDERENLYNTFYSNKGTFGKNEGETFLLWFNALTDSARKRHTIEHLLNNTWNVENMSYFPYIFYQYGYWDEAAKYMLLLTDPKTERREYPEVSYGVILGFVNGLMGIQPDARFNRVETIYKTNSTESCFIENVPLLGTHVSVKHQPGSSEFTNKGQRKVTWRAQFYGSYSKLVVNGKTRKAITGKDALGKTISYTDVSVDPAMKILVSTK